MAATRAQRCGAVMATIATWWCAPTAWAQPSDPPPASDGAEPAPATPAEDGARAAGKSDRAGSDIEVAQALQAIRQQNQELREQNQELREQVELLAEDVEAMDGRLNSLLPVKARISGYLDVGFFHVGGDGSGLRSDIGHVRFPEFSDVPASWVFMGDPLSTMINGRGDPAETAESRAIVFDGVDNSGAASFIVNALNLQLFTGIGERASLHTSVDFVPRSRDVSNPDGLFLGDFVDVKLAYVEYRAPIEAFGLELYAGKFDAVVGREYRALEAPDRLTVAPSLICRYLCGRPVGVKARLLLLDDRLVLNASVTNGSQFTEAFDFADEVDKNDSPTGAARLSYRFASSGGADIDVGISGAAGAQDAQVVNDRLQWHVGADLHAVLGDVELTAEYVRGKATGATEGALSCDLAPCLDYRGAYGLVGYRASNSLIPYVRVDWRDALHQSGASFVYISKLWRLTAGIRAEIGSHLIFKVDYTVNRELGRIPQFANDIFTTAMIVTY